MSFDPIRRVVTGHNAEGRSVILSDTKVAPGTMPVWPSRGVANIWSLDQIPADNSGAPPEGGPKSLPGHGGTAFHIMQLPPESDLDSMSEADRKIATTPVTQMAAHFVKRGTPKHYGMHATNSVDYIIVLKGEVTYVCDEGETVLRPFDTVIQRGTNRTWINKGTEPCLVAVSINSADPLDL